VAHPESSNAQQTSDALSGRLSIVLTGLAACSSAADVDGLSTMVKIYSERPHDAAKQGGADTLPLNNMPEDQNRETQLL